MRCWRSVLLFMILGTILLCGCGKEDEQVVYKQISQDEAKKIMDEESEIIILDVRTEEEFSEGHIPGAICIPNETIDESVSKDLPEKSQTILVYCRSGNRSKQAAQKLIELGYTDIREFGGITTWKYDIQK